MAEVFETTWPDKSFARFGGHVLERLYELHQEFAHIEGKHFKVHVTVEVVEEPPEEKSVKSEMPSALDQARGTGNVASKPGITVTPVDDGRYLERPLRKIPTD